jgi:hypothetical protein
MRMPLPPSTPRKATVDDADVDVDDDDVVVAGLFPPPPSW